ncbi:P450-derived glycosyltransferase activator [Marinactinospora rubrisoli]|uniref:P450-derived glycosyltransferase activator n=1 Tax=Marinactinospora rubrisoli TaxID=2715399 RepID=A0ABW2KLV5_9ACTN
MTLAASAVGRRLHLVHGTRWVHGVNGDAYARLLRGFDDDPHPAYDEIRRRGPLWRSRTGVWVTGRQRVAAELLGHPALAERAPDGFPVADGVLPEDAAAPLIGAAETDGFRARTAHVLGADAVPEYRPRVAEACARLLAGLGTELDLAADVAARLPGEVLADLFGLTGARRRRFADGCRHAAVALDSLQCPQTLAVTRRMRAALDDLAALLTGPATGPAGGVLSALADAAPPEEAAGLRLPVAVTVLVHRTTAVLLANAALAALSRPGEWTRLADEPGRAARVVAETLRHDPPVAVQAMTARTGLKAAGRHIPPGDRIAVVIGAANRDPDTVPDPRGFAPDRTGTPVLHPALLHDLAAPLVRVQAETALATLAARLPALRRTGPVLRARRAPVTRAPLRVPARTA